MTSGSVTDVFLQLLPCVRPGGPVSQTGRPRARRRRRRLPSKSRLPAPGALGWHRAVTKQPRFSGKSLLLWQSAGFFTLLVIMWAAELLRLPHVLFGEPPDLNFPRVLARTAGLVVIWVLVHFTTARLLRRVHELEEFLLICSWCRKVGHRGEWLSLEDYFNSKFSTETSHGICPACAEQQLAAHRATLRCTAATPPAEPGRLDRTG